MRTSKSGKRLIVPGILMILYDIICKARGKKSYGTWLIITIIAKIKVRGINFLRFDFGPRNPKFIKLFLLHYIKACRCTEIGSATMEIKRDAYLQ